MDTASQEGNDWIDGGNKSNFIAMLARTNCAVFVTFMRIAEGISCVGVFRLMKGRDIMSHPTI